MPSTPELGDLLQASAQQAQFELHTAMPGQITAIYDDGQTKRQFADVRPCLRRALPTEEDAPQPLAEEELPILPRVPIGYVQGGGWFISVPLKVGDFVTVIFAERSIDRWLATARKSSQAAVSTGDLGMHTLDGAIALPLGPAPIGELLEGVSATELVIGKSGGGILISLSDTLVQLGATSGTDFVALAAKVKTEIDKALDLVNSHTHVVSGGSVPSGGGPVTGATAAAAGGTQKSTSTAATKVKAI